MIANIYHIVPLNDADDHNETSVIRAIGLPYCNCKCKPEHKEVEGGLLIIHNSFDGREGVEWVNEILNKK